MPFPPGSEAAWRDSHQLAADQAKGDAAGIVGTALALGGGYGALRGLYDSYHRRKQLAAQQKAVQLDPVAMPLVTGKSASLLDKSANFALGDQAHSYGALAVPWLGPGVVAALMGGHALGKGVVSHTTDQNIAEDLKAEREKKKQQYLQAAQTAGHPTAVEQPDVLPMVPKAASEFAPSGMDRWGPELGVGASLTGGLGLFQLMRHYNAVKSQTKQKEMAERDKSMQQEINAMRPTPQPIPTPPVAFAG